MKNNLLTTKTNKMAYSTCCGAHTTMPEIGICPDCLEHCDWEYQEDECIKYDADHDTE
jgi:hypothetical protein